MSDIVVSTGAQLGYIGNSDAICGRFSAGDERQPAFLLRTGFDLLRHPETACGRPFAERNDDAPLTICFKHQYGGRERGFVVYAFLQVEPIFAAW